MLNSKNNPIKINKYLYFLFDDLSQYFFDFLPISLKYLNVGYSAVPGLFTQILFSLNFET
jgi:hypothetical protein